MSSAIPRSVREEAQSPASDTVLHGAQKNAIAKALRFARTSGAVDVNCSRLLNRVENDRVLRQHDRHQLGRVLTAWTRNLDVNTQDYRHASWAKADLWEANRLESEA